MQKDINIQISELAAEIREDLKNEKSLSQVNAKRRRLNMLYQSLRDKEEYTSYL
tara:strand:+ start:6917 stop:7078 length:162 start_codon:yes stop_codon:yes gene_type:complete